MNEWMISYPVSRVTGVAMETHLVVYKSFLMQLMLSPQQHHVEKALFLDIPTTPHA